MKQDRERIDRTRFTAHTTYNINNRSPLYTAEPRISAEPLWMTRYFVISLHVRAPTHCTN